MSQTQTQTQTQAHTLTPTPTQTHEESFLIINSLSLSLSDNLVRQLGRGARGCVLQDQSTAPAAPPSVMSTPSLSTHTHIHTHTHTHVTYRVGAKPASVCMKQVPYSLFSLSLSLSLSLSQIHKHTRAWVAMRRHKDTR
jgi:hypothetical protein